MQWGEMIARIYNWDFAILDAIRANCQLPIFDNIAIFLGKVGEAGLIWIALAIILLISKKTRRTGVTILIGLVLYLVLGDVLLKKLVARPRPFQIRDVGIIVNPPTGYSFPSGHTFSAFVGATVLSVQLKGWWRLAYLYAILVGLSRLYLYVHFPTDVVAGAVLGILVGLLTCYLVSLFWPQPGDSGAQL
jgi:undecaprenyl-diphosphatase